MKLPELTELSTSRDMIDVFGGYNHNLRINEGEFYDMKNLSSSYYPTLSPRQKRGTKTTLETGNLVGLIEKDALCYVKVVGTGVINELYFVMNEEEYNLGTTTIESDVERTIVSMGAYVIIMPDKKYISTVATEDENGNKTMEWGNIEETYISPDDTKVTFNLCKMDGTEYEIDMTSPNEPTDAGKDENGKVIPLPNGYTWLDTSQTPNSLKQYSEASGVWSSIATTYIKIGCVGIGAAFNEYDGVKISGVTVSSLKDDLNNVMPIYAKDDDYIVVVGILENASGLSQTDKITVERLMPELDFLIESNNRLWGCKYGLNRDGDIVNEIYACKLGDFKNWNCFMGISTDSYYVSLGTDGQFTGAISYLGYPTFFKENCLHTVYGNYPAEYQVQDTACRGVQKGSEKSLAMVNEVLYYKSRTGVCAYSGSLPTEVSSVLGEKAYSDAVACSHKGKYYISMYDIAEKDYVLFVCDTEKGLWHKEDNLQVKQFCPIDEEIYYIGKEPNKIKSIFGDETKDTEPIKWMAETGILGTSSPDKKYISRLSIRLMMEIGASVVFSIQYDSSGEWERVCSITGHSLKTFALPIRPKRCDHFRLRLEGEGNVKIFSLSKIIEDGSEL